MKEQKIKHDRDIVSEALSTIAPDFTYEELESLKNLWPEQQLDFFYALSPYILGEKAPSSKYQKAYIKAMKSLNMIKEALDAGAFNHDDAIALIVQTANECEDIVVDTEDAELVLLDVHRKTIEKGRENRGDVSPDFHARQ